MLRFTIVVGSVLSFMPSCPCYGPDLYCGDTWGDGGDEGHGGEDTGAGVCGDGIIDWGEQCDDGGTTPGDGCSDTCTSEGCTWEVAQLTFPIFVWTGQAVLGEITFDANCNLIVGGGEESANIYRVDKDDGSVSNVVPGVHYQMVSGITYRASDKRVYYATTHHDPPDLNPAIYALDDQYQVHEIMPLGNPVWTLTVAPEGFGDFGGQLIGIASFGPSVGGMQAFDVETSVITTFVQSNVKFTAAAFGNDGTLYATDWSGDRIVTVSADGVITPFYTGIDNPSGLAVAPDGSRMFVAHQRSPIWTAEGRIDEISIPGATLTPRVEIEQGFVGIPTGIVVDGANHVLYEVPHTDHNHALVDMFEAP